MSTDPALAAFLQGGGNNGGVYTPVNLSLYAYAGLSPVVYFDPNGKDWLNDLAQGVIGGGDALLFGTGPWIREKLGVDDVVETDSTAYSVANTAVTAAQVASGVAGAVKGGVKLAASVAARRAARREAARQMARRRAGDLVDGAEFVDDAVRMVEQPFVSRRVANSARHVFGKKLDQHKLGEVLDAFDGDAVKAFQGIEDATQSLANRGTIDGVFEATVEVAGKTVTVRGRVMDGVAKVATAFIP